MEEKLGCTFLLSNRCVSLYRSTWTKRNVLLRLFTKANNKKSISNEFFTKQLSFIPRASIRWREHFFFFLTWLQSFRPAKLQCSFPSLWHMEETSEGLLNFSIGIDLLGLDPTSNKNKALNTSQVPGFASLSEALTLFWTIKNLDYIGFLTFKTFLVTLEFIWLWFSPFSP